MTAPDGATAEVGDVVELIRDVHTVPAGTRLVVLGTDRKCRRILDTTHPGKRERWVALTDEVRVVQRGCR